MSSESEMSCWYPQSMLTFEVPMLRIDPVSRPPVTRRPRSCTRRASICVVMVSWWSTRSVSARAPAFCTRRGVCIVNDGGTGGCVVEDCTVGLRRGVVDTERAGRGVVDTEGVGRGVAGTMSLRPGVAGRDGVGRGVVEIEGVGGKGKAFSEILDCKRAISLSSSAMVLSWDCSCVWRA